MLFCSGSKHRDRYVPRPNLKQQLADVKTVLEALRLLPIATPLKKDLLDKTLWHVTFATGNTQTKFMGRYRSRRVIREVGLKIQRDHVYQRKTLLRELLGPSPDLDRIISLAKCCVVLTADEHRSLANIDGGKKYTLAGVTVYDMLDEKKVEPDLA